MGYAIPCSLVFLIPSLPHPVKGGQKIVQVRTIEYQSKAQDTLFKSCNGQKKCICINDAIFKHDSSWATAGVGARTLNPCNTRPSANHPKPFKVAYSKNGPFAQFSTLDDGIISCVSLYQRNYSKLGPTATVKIWSGHSRDKNFPSTPSERAYVSAVASCY